MFIRQLVLAVTTIALASQPGHGQNDGGYKRQLEEAQAKLHPHTLSGDELVKLLGDDRFYNREAAGLELLKRDAKDYDRILDATASSCPETRRRAETIIGRIAGRRREALLSAKAPNVSLKITSPRFWSGNNAWKGNIPDESLDASVEIVSNVHLENVLSPLPVKTGKTDIGESVETLPWGSSRSNSSSAVVYMSKPRLPFTRVEATLTLYAAVRGEPDSCKDEFRCKKWLVRKDTIWIEVTREGQSPFRFVVTDILGRLSETKLNFLDDTGNISDAKVECIPDQHRRVWIIDIKEAKRPPAKFSLDVPAPVLPLERQIKVTIQHP